MAAGSVLGRLILVLGWPMRHSGAFRPIQAHLSCRPGAFLEVQPVETIGQVGQRQFRFGPGQPDGPDEQAITVLLMPEDMFDTGLNGRLFRIGPALDSQTKCTTLTRWCDGEWI